jgi:hypothetical protein
MEIFRSKKINKIDCFVCDFFMQKRSIPSIKKRINYFFESESVQSYLKISFKTFSESGFCKKSEKFLVLYVKSISFN